MIKFLKHMGENLFITFTGIAALVHSTWSLGTMFSGNAPQGNWLAWFGWVIPAFFVAFAMDIGQISTSAAIRHNGLTWQRGVTFFVFALATYYLQFLYIAHHLPLLALADGISDTHRELVKTSVDAAIWILPLLLPLSTMLYTISGGDTKEQATDQKPLPAPEISITLPEPMEEPILPLLEENHTEFASVDIEPIPVPLFVAHCEACGWEKPYEDSAKMERGLNTHKSIHCKAKVVQEVSAENGHA
jgi:hypothetical protein